MKKLILTLILLTILLATTVRGEMVCETRARMGSLIQDCKYIRDPVPCSLSPDNQACRCILEKGLEKNYEVNNVVMLQIWEILAPLTPFHFYI